MILAPHATPDGGRARRRTLIALAGLAMLLVVVAAVLIAEAGEALACVDEVEFFGRPTPFQHRYCEAALSGHGFLGLLLVAASSAPPLLVIVSAAIAWRRARWLALVVCGGVAMSIAVTRLVIEERVATACSGDAAAAGSAAQLGPRPAA